MTFLDNVLTPVSKQLKETQTPISPPTPHRIELCSDSDETANVEEIPPSEKLPQLKAKKRFK